MKKIWLILTTGFALFSMFFGSGNLVFPLLVGRDSGGHTLLSSLGISLTGVLVPFLGVFAVVLFKGNLNEFFGSFGKRGAFWFSFLALALMGPFGVLARCLTVADGALQMLFPSFSSELASIILCSAIFFLTVNKNRIVSVLGFILTPLLLLAIGALAWFGLQHKGADFSGMTNYAAFKGGFFQGYQMMDLLAAFFFSRFLITHFSEKEERVVHKLVIRSSIIGGTILASVYLLLVLLGWTFSPLLTTLAPEKMLGSIALAALGPMAAPCVCVMVVLACLTTAIVLTSLFADFLRTEVCKNKLSKNLSLLITLFIGFIFSTMNFSGIAEFLGPIMEIIYPALIMLTMWNIAHKLWGLKSTHWPVTLTVALRLCLI